MATPMPPTGTIGAAASDAERRRTLPEPVVSFDLPVVKRGATGSQDDLVDKEKELDLEASLTLVQSLRQSRLTHLTALLPFLSTRHRTATRYHAPPKGYPLPADLDPTKATHSQLHLARCDVAIGPLIFVNTRFGEAVSASAPAPMPVPVPAPAPVALPATKSVNTSTAPAAAAGPSIRPRPIIPPVSASSSSSGASKPPNPSQAPQATGPVQVAPRPAASNGARPPPPAGAAPLTGTGKGPVIGAATGSQQNASSAPPAPGAAAPRPAAPTPAPAAKIDPILVQEVSRRAQSDPPLQRLLHIAANGRASQEELRSLAAIIAKIGEEMKAAGTDAPAAAGAATGPVNGAAPRVQTGGASGATGTSAGTSTSTGAGSSVGTVTGIITNGNKVVGAGQQQTPTQIMNKTSSGTTSPANRGSPKPRGRPPKNPGATAATKGTPRTPSGAGKMSEKASGSKTAHALPAYVPKASPGTALPAGASSSPNGSSAAVAPQTKVENGVAPSASSIPPAAKPNAAASNSNGISNTCPIITVEFRENPSARFILPLWRPATVIERRTLPSSRGPLRKMIKVTMWMPAIGSNAARAAHAIAKGEPITAATADEEENDEVPAPKPGCQKDPPKGAERFPVTWTITPCGDDDRDDSGTEVEKEIPESLWDAFGRVITSTSATLSSPPESITEKEKALLDAFLEKYRQATPMLAMTPKLHVAAPSKDLQDHLTDRFVPRLHSLSHRPVVRLKKGDENLSALSGAAAHSQQAQFVPITASSSFSSKRARDESFGSNSDLLHGTPRRSGDTGAGGGDDEASPPTVKPKRKRHVATHNPDGTLKLCQACGTNTTPMWRRGPAGKSTLCNACGAKWKVGRLVVPDHPPTAMTPTATPAPATAPAASPSAAPLDAQSLTAAAVPSSESQQQVTEQQVPPTDTAATSQENETNVSEVVAEVKVS